MLEGFSATAPFHSILEASLGVRINRVAAKEGELELATQHTKTRRQQDVSFAWAREACSGQRATSTVTNQAKVIHASMLPRAQDADIATVAPPRANRLCKCVGI